MVADVHLFLSVALAGLASFLSPCVLTLVPPYLVYLAGVATLRMARGGELLPRAFSDEVDAGSSQKMRQTQEARASFRFRRIGTCSSVWRAVISSSLAFVLGFMTVFVLLGAGASGIGRLLALHKDQFALGGGIAIMLAGLHVLGFSRLLTSSKAGLPASVRPWVPLVSGYGTGVAFALCWTPCVGPVLATVRNMATHEESLSYGLELLLAYAAGLAIPFLVAAVALSPAMAALSRFPHQLDKIQKALGALLAAAGLMFATDTLNSVGSSLLDTFPALSQIEDAVTPAALPAEIGHRMHRH